MRIHPFAGTRYADSIDAGPLAGPPYDQIDTDLQQRLHRNPLHFAHLIRPGNAVDPHRRAAELHAGWMEEGLLLTDSGPNLYPYEIEIANSERRLGLCTLVGIEDETSQTIRPHEATVPKTVEERLRLLRQTRVDLEPILLLAEDDGGLNRLLAEDLGELQPLTAHRDADGNVHRLYRVDAADRLQRYRRHLASVVGLIADGHHRYTVARRFAASDGHTEGAAAAKLAVVTSLASPGLRIDPIHRRLDVPCAVEKASHFTRRRRELRELTGVEIAREVAVAPQPSLAITSDGRVELWELDTDRAPVGLPEHLRHLAVGWLHEALFRTFGLEPEAATDGTVGYRSDPEKLLEEWRLGDATAAFWLPPMNADDFARAMAGGEILPPKSTRFLPKLASGLVWARHDCAIS